MNRIEFLDVLMNQPIINSHSHHLPDERHHTLTLEDIFNNSYVGWCGVAVPSGDDRKEIAEWLDAVGNRSYFVWLEKALMELYGIEERLDADNWNIFDSAIRQAHQDKDWHINLLRKKCGYEAIVLDTYWSPGEDNGHPKLFKPAYRINSILYGYNQTAKDHNGNNIQIMHSRSITDIDEYLDFIDQVVLDAKRVGSVALKCAIAYDRSLNFGEASKEEAQKAMTEDPDKGDIKKFQDYAFDYLCRLAAKLDIPMQIHTGLGLMESSNAMELQPIIASNPETTFLLMHGSYPWTSDIAGLTHVYPNVCADLCWLPLISPAAAHRLLHELIDVCNADRIVWGCDTWTSEESYGAKLAFLHVLSRVLSERVEAGLMGRKGAFRFAKAVMYDNATGLFGVSEN